MYQTIEAGTLKDIVMKLLDRLFGGLEDNFDKMDVEVTKKTKNDPNKVINNIKDSSITSEIKKRQQAIDEYNKTVEPDQQVDMELQPGNDYTCKTKDGQDLFISIVSLNNPLVGNDGKPSDPLIVGYIEFQGKITDFHAKSEKEAMDFINKFLQQINEEIDKNTVKEKDNGNDIAVASKQMKVTLQKVTGSKEAEINMIAITANYDITEAYDNLQDVLDDDTFAESIPEEPTSYSIVPCEDSYEVDEIQESVTDNTVYHTIFYAASNLATQLKYMDWMASGDSKIQIHNVIDNLSWDISRLMDSLAKKILANTSIVPFIPGQDSLQFQSASMECLVDLVKRFIDVADIVYVNIDDAYIQSEVLDTIEKLRSQLDYTSYC